MIAWIASASAVLICCVSEGPPQTQPNIVFIMGDDHTSQAWGCYQSRLAPLDPTPNIDRLASEGARLANCCCTNSICVPSRASILTGQYSHVNRIKTLREALDPAPDNVAKRLQQAGYQTALVGKWHLKKRPAGFDYWNVIRGQGRYHDPAMFEMDLDQGAVQEGRYSTDVFTDKALAWLDRRDAEKPFCLMLHFKATHEPWQFPARHAGLYDDVDVPEPPTLLGPTGPRGSVVPGWPLEILTERMVRGGHGAGKLRLDTDDPQAVRRATYQKFLKDLLRCARAVDENVGRVLDYLDRHELDRNTVVICTSDQGYFLGEHNYFDKRFMLEESLRMPFVVRYPPEIEPNTVVDDVVLNVDFAPTFLDYAGAELYCISRWRHAAQKTEAGWRNCSLRTQFRKILRRAGVEPWPKPWQNLRSSRETELAEQFPVHVACAWIGNSRPVAMEHYLQVTDEHYQQATKKAAQYPAELGRQAAQPKGEAPAFPGECEGLRAYTQVQVGDDGLEPPTSTV